MRTCLLIALLPLSFGFKLRRCDDFIEKVLEVQTASANKETKTFQPIDVNKPILFNDIFYSWRRSNKSQCKYYIGNADNFHLVIFNVDKAPNTIYWQCTSSERCTHMHCEKIWIFAIFMIFIWCLAAGVVAYLFRHPLWVSLNTPFIYDKWMTIQEFYQRQARRAQRYNKYILFQVFRIRLRMSKCGRVPLRNLDLYSIDAVLQKMNNKSLRTLAMTSSFGLSLARRIPSMDRLFKTKRLKKKEKVPFGRC